MRAEWFGANLRRLREGVGLTQRGLAQRAGRVTVRTLSHLEAGDWLPGWDTVVALCGALGCTPDAFVADPGEVPPKRPRGRPKRAGAYNAGQDAGAA